MAARNSSSIVPKDPKRWVGIMIVVGVSALAFNTLANRVPAVGQVRSKINNGL